jgi:hypothetical protein
MTHSYQGDRKGSPLHITVRFSLLLCACEVENVCGHRENGVLLLMLVPMGVRRCSRKNETNLLPCSFHKNLLMRGGRLPRPEGILPLL